jgi:hypothetical protein
VVRTSKVQLPEEQRALVEVKVKLTASAGWEATAEITAKPTKPIKLLR